MMSVSSSSPEIVDVSLQALTQHPESFYLLDVRSRFEYALGHAPSATNLSLPRLMMGRTSWLRNWVLPTWFKELPKDQPIAVICLTAHRSPIAAKALLAMGFSQVFNVTGGMMAWQQAGLPTQKN